MAKSLELQNAQLFGFCFCTALLHCSTLEFSLSESRKQEVVKTNGNKQGLKILGFIHGVQYVIPTRTRFQHIIFPHHRSQIVSFPCSVVSV